MYAIGVLSSYVSQGVYAVAGPFQGAVDIIVVQQEDGTYKSSPWYVKCGDFQGVLTRREKIVNISVNGVPAEFYMLLNNRGEAYFEKEVEDAVLAFPRSSPSKSTEKEGNLDKPCSPDIEKQNGDFQTEGNLASSAANGVDSQDESQQDDLNFPVLSALDHPYLDNEPSSTAPEQPQIIQREFDEADASKDAEDDSDSRISTGAGQTDSQSMRENSPTQSDFKLEVKPVLLDLSSDDIILADDALIFSKQQPFGERQQGSSSLDSGSGLQASMDEGHSHPTNESANEITSMSGMDETVLCNTVIDEDWFGLQEPSTSEAGLKNASCKTDLEASSFKPMDEFIWNDYKIVTAEEEGALNDSLRSDSVLGLRFDSQSLRSCSSAPMGIGPLDSSVWVSNALVDDAMGNASTTAGDDRIVRQNSFHETSSASGTPDKDVICRVDESLPVDDTKPAEIPTIAVVPSPSRWTMWPLSFRRSRGEKPPVTDSITKTQALLAATNIAVGSPLTEEILTKNGYYEWTQKPKLRSYVPTSAQIESLKLNNGPNKVTFMFPRVLGRTQVDANIYLWKWNTRIVISDVDGTITKSDVLGQFMPLVGRDWSQSGVTRLFSAIKENGYEVLFLSARAISQAYITRQFLVNLKQDGETLPEGPVFISPDGLIPSLYREVVRRTPHEFKISCLEGIRRLFPNDVNPFYAGFGNRDTDEISYLKVGIPNGKIFIINPKGEVMVNHHVDVKSYTSIHSLVDDMFPPVFTSEQEDFNTWNYWKLPLPTVDDEELSSNVKSTKPKKGPSLKK